MPRGFAIQPVGFVRRPSEAGEGTSFIEVRRDMRLSMRGLESGDRVRVLYWADRLPEAEAQPQDTEAEPATAGKPVREVFAMHSPTLPSPIGSTVVQIVEVREDGLVVSGLDAPDGTPVLDIKTADDPHGGSADSTSSPQAGPATGGS